MPWESRTIIVGDERSVFCKQPNELLDYLFDFSQWLPVGDTIASITASIQTVFSTWGNVPETSAAAISSSSFASTTATVWVEEGNSGDKVLVSVTATTTGGRIKDASFFLRIEGIIVPIPQLETDNLLAALTQVIAALPTTLPAGPGVLWNNGGVVCIS